MGYQPRSLVASFFLCMCSRRGDLSLDPWLFAGRAYDGQCVLPCLGPPRQCWVQRYEFTFLSELSPMPLSHRRLSSAAGCGRYVFLFFLTGYLSWKTSFCRL